MERKKFLEVFPDIQVREDILAVLEYVDVTRVTTNREHTKMRVYIESSRLIEKSAIFAYEKAIAKSLSAGKRLEIKIIEKYKLSNQYTLANLMEAYKDSIMREINLLSPALSAMFRTAPITIDGQTIIIDFEENIVSEAKVEEMKDVIKNIFSQRFDMDVNVEVALKKGDTEIIEKRHSRKLENEVQNIIDKLQSDDDDVEDNEEEIPEEKEETKEKPKASEKSKLRNTLPRLIYGKDYKDDEILELKDIYEGTGSCVIKGEVINLTTRETRTGKFLIIMDVTDYTDSVTLKLFLPDEHAKDEFLLDVDEGKHIEARGVIGFDEYDGQVEMGRVLGLKRIKPFKKEIRMDTAVDKRVELHCHTTMSEMDAVTDVKKIVRRAYEWGHKAIAITDHGVVQAFPEAWKEYQKIVKECKEEGKECDFKVILGVEAYLVDDLKNIVTNSKGQSLDETYVVFDLETTGFSPVEDRIIEIGAVKIKNGEIVDRFAEFVNPERPIPFRIEELTGISDSMVEDAETIEKVLPRFMEFAEGSIMVGHNVEFDMSFIEENCRRQDIPCDFTSVDTVGMARFMVEGLARYKLNNVAKALNIPLEHHHRAVDDAETTALIFQKLCAMAAEDGMDDLDKINEKGMKSTNRANKLASHHAVILVENWEGRKNLYKLISKSHIETYYRRPRIMKSDYLKMNEGLIIGSACSKGELYEAVFNKKTPQEIARIADFYDYFEVQPIGNNEYMIRTGDPAIDDEKKALVDSEEDLQEVNKRIIELGKKMGKKTVATCDVHFLDPEDELYRRIIQYGNKFSDADRQPPLYLRTTNEMLEQFAYLGSDLAREIVIDNTNEICDKIDVVSPIHPDKCPPVLENSEKQLKDICFEKAKEVYGDDLPEIVENRLDVELDSIIGNGYAVMYIMAQRLVWKSLEDGYLVGSRGSVGSSFAATMAGITECNPLPPHYHCPECRTSIFENEYSLSKDIDESVIKEYQDAITEVRSISGVGYDLPKKKCPCCGANLEKDGLEIPFETFLGFGGTKEPDIDLNFSGEYQARAHEYTEEMFGKGSTFRAGTISGIAEKTAFGYVKNYYQDHQEEKRKAEIERIKQGCTGIRRTTGQHPGGIVIVPRDKEIYDFTPIQRPANDMNTDIITTHFDYHAIESNLLKLDELGHDDPTMIKRLEELTGTNVKKDVPFDDEKVMSLFESPEALGISSSDIDNCPTGSLGLPELGTDFVIQMIVDTKPTHFADLVRLAGLSHGTDVWLNNAQTLIREKQCTLSSAICTRDDIMVYLMNKGIDPEMSFQTMESVRRGRKIPTFTDADGNEIDVEQLMKEHGVPEWYIWSCKRIQYMFPKAHAAAYIMMALRIAWYKVYHPLAYYAAFFGIRSKAFNYEKMCLGRKELEQNIAEYKKQKKANITTDKADAEYIDMRVVREMYARGFEFTPIDIYKAKATEFQIVDGKLMPSLVSIDGMGEKAARSLEEGVRNQGGSFTSKTEMAEKCKLNKTVMETMTKLGLLEGMPEDSQLSIFDF